jgi:lysosomal acid lipase/cholesteryl ester hydrolase
MAHFPAGASTQSLVHYGQIIKSKEWTLFDWGSSEKNQEKYGQENPPRVEIENLTSLPTAFFVGTSDDLGDTVDA